MRCRAISACTLGIVDVVVAAHLHVGILPYKWRAEPPTDGFGVNCIIMPIRFYGGRTRECWAGDSGGQGREAEVRRCSIDRWPFDVGGHHTHAIVGRIEKSKVKVHVVRQRPLLRL